MAHPIRPDSYIAMNNFYTATVYEKGAEVVRMLAHAARRRTASGAAWTSTSSATTARPSPATTSSPRWPTRTASTSRSSRAGTRRPARRSSTRERQLRRRGATLHARRSRSACRPTPGQPQQAAAAHPGARSACSARTARTCRCARRRDRGRAPTTRVLELAEPRAAFRLRRRAGAPGAVAAARLLGAGAPRDRLHRDELALLAAHDSDPVNRWDAGAAHVRAARLALVAAGQRAAARWRCPTRASSTPSRGAARRPRRRRRCSRSR